MKFKNVLIASDFDGTLKNDEGIITPDVIEKIQYHIFLVKINNSICFHLYNFYQ